MVRYGMTPEQVLQSVTRIPAMLLGVEGELGTIEAGKIADIVILDGDPLTDIGAVRRVDTVIKGGRVIQTDEE